MRFAVGDVHGHRGEVRAALAARGLLDDEGDWVGGDAQVWFMGDLMDRGPDGAGVVEDVMRWQHEAEDSGGQVESVLGNHEVLALGFWGVRDGGISTLASYETALNFMLSWHVNGGQRTDQERFTADMVDWMRRRPAIVAVDGDLMMHADTVEYLEWGSDVESINKAAADVLIEGDLQQIWDLWAAMTSRHAFLGDDGPASARGLLDTLGGRRIVHGHSIIADLVGGEPSETTEALEYAEGLVLAVDGGIYAGGPSLVAPLD